MKKGKPIKVEITPLNMAGHGKITLWLTREQAVFLLFVSLHWRQQVAEREVLKVGTTWSIGVGGTLNYQFWVKG